MFNYRDYVPALAYTLEAKRLEDLLQTDFSRASQAPGDDLSGSAKAVLAGLSRMIADFKAHPVAGEILEAARDGVRKDLAVSVSHERTLKKMLSGLQKDSMRAANSGQSKLLADVAALKEAVRHELHESRKVSAAYRETLKGLATLKPKILTPEETAQVEFIDKRLAELREFQGKLKERPEDMLTLATRYAPGKRFADPEIPPPHRSLRALGRIENFTIRLFAYRYLGSRALNLLLALFRASPAGKRYSFAELTVLVQPRSPEGLSRFLAVLEKLGVVARAIQIDSPATRWRLADFATLQEVPEELYDWSQEKIIHVQPDNLRVVYIT